MPLSRNRLAEGKRGQEYMASTQARRSKADPRSAKPSAKTEKATRRSASDRPAMVDRRAQILEIASRRFAEFGFEATTVRQIADDANILSGSLYHHFATKDEMLHEIVRDAVFQMRDNTQRIATAACNAEHRLVALILLDLGELTRNEQVHAILYNERKFFRKSEEFSYVRKAKKDAYLAWRSVVEEGMKAGLFNRNLDVYLTILTIVRMLNAAADWYRNDVAAMDLAGNYTLEQWKDFYLRFILDAVRDPARASEPIPQQACEELASFQSHADLKTTD